MPLPTLAVPTWRQEAAGPLGEADDLLPEEGPLAIRVGGADLGVIMRTPGHDEELAMGFALGEGVLEHPDVLAEARLCRAGRDGGPARVDLELEAGIEVDPSGWLRTGLISSGCGVCGREAIDLVARNRGPIGEAITLDADLLRELPSALRGHQPLFDATGSTHAAGLFEADGTLVVAREDVGRHNAVDKVLGRSALEGRWPPPPVLVTTSRGSFDIVQKAVVAGVQVLAMASGPSALAVQVALASDLTLVGFLRPPRMVIYTHRRRIQAM